MKKEAELYPGLVRDANRAGWHLFRIVDDGINRKPFDIAGAAPDGTAVGLEVKVVAGSFAPERRWDWKIFAMHQVAWLEAYVKTEAYAFAAIWFDGDQQTRVFVLAPNHFATNPLMKEMPNVILGGSSIYEAGICWASLLGLIRLLEG